MFPFHRSLRIVAFKVTLDSQSLIQPPQAFIGRSDSALPILLAAGGSLGATFSAADAQTHGLNALHRNRAAQQIVFGPRRCLQRTYMQRTKDCINGYVPPTLF